MSSRYVATNARIYPIPGLTPQTHEAATVHRTYHFAHHASCPRLPFSVNKLLTFPSAAQWNRSNDPMDGDASSSMLATIVRPNVGSALRRDNGTVSVESGPYHSHGSTHAIPPEITPKLHGVKPLGVPTGMHAESDHIGHPPCN